MFNIVFSNRDELRRYGNGDSYTICVVTASCCGVSVSDSFEVTSPDVSHVFEANIFTSNSEKDIKICEVNGRLKERLEIILRACIRQHVDLSI